MNFHAPGSASAPPVAKRSPGSGDTPVGSATRPRSATGQARRLSTAPSPTPTMKTRPCKPGDVLLRSTSASGAFYTIEVGHPEPHPSSGTTTDHSIAVVLSLYIPAPRGEIAPRFWGKGTLVMGETLSQCWGHSQPQTRRRQKRLQGPAVAPLVAVAQQLGCSELAEIQAVVDTHDASVRAQASAREAAYERWQVQE